METTTQELIYQIIMMIVTGILTFIGAELKSYLAKKKAILGYEFDNAKVERIIENSVNFAEAKSKKYLKEQSKKIASSKKLDFARTYINKVDKKIAIKYGDKLNDMIERKVIQVVGV